MSPLVYLMKQLGLKMGDLSALSTKDKEDLRRYAVEKMTALGLEIK